LHGYVFTMQYPCGWVSPFGHCRIKACCQLPDTFRRLPRPSSPLTAKASTVCAYSLDHITPSRLRVIVVPGSTNSRREYQRQLQMLGPLGPRLSLNRHVWTFVSNARYVPSCKRTRTRLQRRMHSIFKCARSIQSWWWVWEDSNHRPHPYQGCALTT
jgi:hypothetical protein